MRLIVHGRSTVHRFARRLGLLAAFLYGTGAAAALLVWALAGDRSWTLSVNATTFWWTLPGLPLLLVALALRSRRAAVPLAVPAVAFVWAYGGLFVGSPAAVEPDLRVASYNTFIRAPDISHVIQLVRVERPDVLLVQEVQPRRVEELTAHLGDAFPHATFETREADRIGGVGVLSRFPIVEERPVTPVGGSRPTRIVVLDVHGQPVQVVAVHLTSPCRVCGPSLVERQGYEARMRRAEVEAVLGALDPDVPVILGGDLNATRRSDPYRLLASAGFRDPQVEVGSGPGFTWPDGSGPFLRIDWIVVRGLTPTGAWVGPPRGSDHHPVVVDVALDTVPAVGDGRVHAAARGTAR